jgi:hypothetical protein
MKPNILSVMYVCIYLVLVTKKIFLIMNMRVKSFNRLLGCYGL